MVDFEIMRYLGHLDSTGRGPLDADISTLQGVSTLETSNETASTYENTCRVPSRLTSHSLQLSQRTSCGRFTVEC